MTVTGPVATDDIGIVLVHEHIFLDMRHSYKEHHPDAQYGRPEIHMLGEWRRDYSKFPDFMALDDVELAISEIARFAESGGKTIVDATPIGARPQSRQLYPSGLRTVAARAGVNVIRVWVLHPRGLRTVAARAGVNVIAGCGFYIQRPVRIPPGVRKYVKLRVPR